MVIAVGFQPRQIMQGQFRFILVVIIIIACLSWGLKRHINRADERAQKEAETAESGSATNNLATNAAGSIVLPPEPAPTGADNALAIQVQVQIRALNDVLTQQIQKQAEVNKNIETALNDLSSRIDSSGSADGTAGNPDPRVIQLEAMMQVMKVRDLIGLSNRLQRVEVMMTRLSAGPAPVSEEQMQQAIEAKLRGIQKDAEQNQTQLKALREQLDALKIKASKKSPTVKNELRRSQEQAPPKAAVASKPPAKPLPQGTATALKMAPVANP